MRIFVLYLLVLMAIPVNGQTWKDQKVESFFLENDFNEAKNYIELRLAASPLPSDEQTAYYLSKLSHAYLRIGEFSKALELAKKAEINTKTIPDKLLKSESWRAMTFAYIRTSQLDSALVYAKKMYRYGKESANYDFTRAAIMAMGNISMQLKNFESAFQFYNDALDLTTKNNTPSNLKVDYYNVGLALTSLKKIEKSNLYLEKALEKATKENDDILLARIYGSFLNNYSLLNNNSKRIYYQEKANKIAKKNNNLQLLAMGYTNMMQWSLSENNPTKAIEYGRHSINYLKKLPIKQLEVKVDSMMYVALKTIKRNNEALHFLESYTRKKNKMSSSETEKNLNELIVKYNVENKNLKIKNQTIQLIAAKRERNIYILITFMLALVVFSIGFLKMNRRVYKKIIYKKERYYDNLLLQMKSIIRQSNYKKPDSEVAINFKNLEEKSEVLYNKLIDTIEKERLFLKPDLDQKTLIRMLGTNKKYLYEAIKFHGESNFRGIINRLRVNFAKKIIEKHAFEGNDSNFSQLFIESGFNANSTFYRIFKSITGLSPVEYSIEFKNDLKINKIRATKKNLKHKSKT